MTASSLWYKLSYFYLVTPLNHCRKSLLIWLLGIIMLGGMVNTAVEQLIGERRVGPIQLMRDTPVLRYKKKRWQVNKTAGEDTFLQSVWVKVVYWEIFFFQKFPFIDRRDMFIHVFQRTFSLVCRKHSKYNWKLGGIFLGTRSMKAKPRPWLVLTKLISSVTNIQTRLKIALPVLWNKTYEYNIYGVHCAKCITPYFRCRWFH